MNQQQNERVRKTQLTPERIDDDVINRADWVADLHKVVASSDGVAAVVGANRCLVHDLEHRCWYHYQLSQLSNNVRSWVLTRDGARLWGLVDGGKLATLDLRSGEWMKFQHHLNYQSILYAEKDAVVVQYRDIAAIDALRLENDSLRRITSIPMKPRIVSGEIKSAFWLERGRFIVLEEGDHNFHIVLQNLDWDGRSKRVLDVMGRKPLLCLPFVVMCDKDEKKLIYADLREDPEPEESRDINLPLKSINLPLKSEEIVQSWPSLEAFAFGNSLIVALKIWHRWYSCNERFVIIREAPYKQLYECRPYEQKEDFFDLLSKFRFRLLGRFLTLGGKWAYDLVARQEVHDMPWSALLHQAIQDEAKQQQVACTTAMPMLTQAQESSDIDTFKTLLNTSPFCISISELVEQVANQGSFLWHETSSSRHSPLFVRGIAPTVHLLSKDWKRLSCLVPEPKRGWEMATFDEHGRVWACDKFGRYITVVDPDKQEGHWFVMPRILSPEVGAMAAYDNSLAIASRNEFVVYRYEDRLLKEMLFWESENRSMIVGIKPDIKKRGLWIITLSSNLSSCELKYLSLNENISAPEKVEQIDHHIYTLGDWPEKVYFVYIDNSERALHYTLDPREGWRKVSLQSFVQENDRIFPVSMSSNDNSAFALLGKLGKLGEGDAALLIRIRIKADNAELISAFEGRPKFARWDRWLMLYSNKPIAFAQAYANRAEIEDLPENKRILFFHLSKNCICEIPIEPYSVTDALGRLIMRGNLPKFL